MKVPSNAEACVSVGGCVLAVDLLTTAHETAERTSVPLQSNLIASTAFVEPQKEWHYLSKDGAQVGPMEKDGIRRAWSKQEIDWNTKCWASGMTEWRKLCDIRELRWALASRVSVLKPTQVGDVELEFELLIIFLSWLQITWENLITLLRNVKFSCLVCVGVLMWICKILDFPVT
jgi:DnaJ family protein C protein 13